MRRARGQSMVEMALLLPFMLILIFGIIDMGWYVYGLGTLFQAARNGSEVAASLPPFEDTLASPSERSRDLCYQTIVAEVTKQTVLFSLGNSVNVVYPDPDDDAPRDIGKPIAVEVTATLRAITPLPQLVRLSNDGVFTMTARSVRSIESLGFVPPSTDHPNGVVCR